MEKLFIMLQLLKLNPAELYKSETCPLGGFFGVLRRLLNQNFGLILFENQIQTTSVSPCRTQVLPTASFLVCSLIFIEYKNTNLREKYLISQSVGKRLHSSFYWTIIG